MIVGEGLPDNVAILDGKLVETWNLADTGMGQLTWDPSNPDVRRLVEAARNACNPANRLLERARGRLRDALKPFGGA